MAIICFPYRVLEGGKGYVVVMDSLGKGSGRAEIARNKATDLVKHAGARLNIYPDRYGVLELIEAAVSRLLP